MELAKLPAPGRPDIEDYRAVSHGRSEPARAALIGAEPRIAAAYAAYSVPGPDPIAPIATTIPEAEALKSNFRALDEGRALATVRSALFDAVPLLRCPYCGTGIATTLDHYLPKARFPEFSILGVNLVPSCGRCNLKKLSALPYRAGRRIRHVYFDELPVGERYLAAEIVAGEDRIDVTFSVVRSETMTEEQVGGLRLQFEMLDLGTLYRIEAARELVDRRLQIVTVHAAGGSPAVVRYLEGEAASAVAGHGVNCWRAVLLDALAGSDPFCEGGFDVIEHPTAW
ncbi:MAG TPA: hypothetical protein VK507_22890 [Iamia sp.]|nr:hypothetical protein [Iamia sp.]